MVTLIVRRVGSSGFEEMKEIKEYPVRVRKTWLEVVVLMKKVVKNSAMIYGAFGLLIGISMFILSLGISDFTFSIGKKEITGIWTGVIAIFFVPFIMGVVGAVHGVMIWFPLTYIYKKLMNNQEQAKWDYEGEVVSFKDEK